MNVIIKLFVIITRILFFSVVSAYLNKSAENWNDPRASKNIYNFIFFLLMAIVIDFVCVTITLSIKA